MLFALVLCFCTLAVSAQSQYQPPSSVYDTGPFLFREAPIPHVFVNSQATETVVFAVSEQGTRDLFPSYQLTPDTYSGGIAITKISTEGTPSLFPEAIIPPPSLIGTISGHSSILEPYFLLDPGW